MMLAEARLLLSPGPDHRGDRRSGPLEPMSMSDMAMYHQTGISLCAPGLVRRITELKLGLWNSWVRQREDRSPYQRLVKFTT